MTCNVAKPFFMLCIEIELKLRRKRHMIGRLSMNCWQDVARGAGEDRACGNFAKINRCPSTQVVIQLKVGVHLDQVEPKERVFTPQYRDVFVCQDPVVVVGAGPRPVCSRLYALIEVGKKTDAFLEEGNAWRAKQDLNRLYKTGVANEDSNYGFGKAGTFSDE